MNWGVIFTQKIILKKIEWGTPTLPLENTQIAGKTWKSRFSRKILIHDTWGTIWILAFTFADA
jgi:hypothetical protein